jgi:uncharacterized membrane protein YagU involved in acid resistance
MHRELAIASGSPHLESEQDERWPVSPSGAAVSSAGACPARAGWPAPRPSLPATIRNLSGRRGTRLVDAPQRGEEEIMASENRRSVGEGVTAGTIAGVIFAMMEIIGAATMGTPALMPIRMFASVVLGKGAMEGPLGTALLVGTIAHLLLSAVFGIAYGVVSARLSGATRTSFGRQAGIGILFGLAVWFVNFQIIARVLYPWFLGTPQFLQAMMHGLFFGLPLALIYAASERRVHAPAAATRSV